MRTPRELLKPPTCLRWPKWWHRRRGGSYGPPVGGGLYGFERGGVSMGEEGVSGPVVRLPAWLDPSIAGLASYTY